MIRCRRYRRQLPLLVGGDLDERLALRVRLHLRNCPECAAAAEAMRRAHSVLQESAAEPVPMRGESLWPGLRPLCRTENASRSEWRGWLPTACLAAACLAVAVGIVFLPEAPRALSGVSAQPQQTSSSPRWRDELATEPPTAINHPWSADPDRHFLLPEAKLVSERRGSF